MSEAWIALGKMKAQLHPNQRKRLDSVLWLIDDQYMAEGRSTVLAVAFIQLALQNPKRWVHPFDHSLALGGSFETVSEVLMNYIRIRIESSFVGEFEFKRYEFRYVPKE